MAGAAAAPAAAPGAAPPAPALPAGMQIVCKPPVATYAELVDSAQTARLAPAAAAAPPPAAAEPPREPRRYRRMRNRPHILWGCQGRA